MAIPHEREWERGEQHESMFTIRHIPTGTRFVCKDHRLAFDSDLRARLSDAIDRILSDPTERTQ